MWGRVEPEIYAHDLDYEKDCEGNFTLTTNRGFKLGTFNEEETWSFIEFLDEIKEKVIKDTKEDLLSNIKIVVEGSVGYGQSRWDY
jgi:hypothetical protein